MRTSVVPLSYREGRARGAAVGKGTRRRRRVAGREMWSPVDGHSPYSVRGRENLIMFKAADIFLLARLTCIPSSPRRQTPLAEFKFAPAPRKSPLHQAT